VTVVAAIDQPDWAAALDRISARRAAYQPSLDEYRRLLLIRRTEERLLELHQEGLVAGAIHPCIGQEAVSVGVVGALGPQDCLTVTFRGHGHALARGVPCEGVAAEVLGRTTGVCGGRAGSMIMIDQDRGLITASAIVAGAVPAAVGAALAAKRLGEPSVAATFFGDGATAQGVVYESILLAAMWKLPVVFVCENNLYSEMTPLAEISPVAGNLAGALSAVAGVPGLVVDGNSVREVRGAAEVAIERARSGAGPVVIEARTYRLRGHYSGDPEHYRPAEEVESWRARDPIPRYADELTDAGVSVGELEVARKAVEDEVEAALTAALAAPVAGEPA
jgi:pyruvate dehydrogenase E1 component alpha subunit